MSLFKNQANYFNLEHIGWKHYNTIIKKAVEQEFSWSGLLISLSIAFFIVIVGSFMLSIVYHSIENKKAGQNYFNRDLNYLERRIESNLAFGHEANYNKYIYIS